MDEQGLSPEGDDFEAEDNVLPLPAEELTEHSDCSLHIFQRN